MLEGSVNITICLALLLALSLGLVSTPVAESYSSCHGPIVITDEASVTSGTTVTLNGTLLDKGNSHIIFVSFVWGIGDESCTIAECEDRDCSPGDCLACGNETPIQAMQSAGTFRNPLIK